MAGDAPECEEIGWVIPFVIPKRWGFNFLNYSKMKAFPYFRRELDLVQTFSVFLKCGGLPSQTRMVLEFESGHGIADIVIFGTRKLFEQRVVEFAKIPPRYAVIFGRELLPKKFSAQQFSDLTGTGINASVRVLNVLVKQYVLKRLEDERYESIGSYASPVGSIVSIEAKLRDWRRALRQAYRYREFSNQSWVLLDTSRVSPALAQIQQFVRFGVGLASINTSGELFIHHAPLVTAPFSDSRYWAESVLLSRHYLKEL